MTQYIKYYWTDNLGNYQTVANQSVDRRHPNIEGGSTKYWLKNFNTGDYEEEYRLPVRVRGVNRYPVNTLLGLK
jgi:ribosomal protein L15E